MPNGFRRNRLAYRVLALAFALGVVTWARPAAGYTPESPEVKRSIERGLGFLSTAGGQEMRLGGKCLVGMCFWKNGHPIEHPLIQAGIQACRDGVKISHNETYSPALALIYLCELEAQQPELRDLTQQYVDLIVKRQQGGGGWGYSNLQTGDTSQTQYGALALWMAANHGHQIPQDSAERLCGWLVRTQDPTGTWGYQGQDPGGYNRINQPKDQFRMSLHVGGIGSLYVAADLLGIIQSKQVQVESTLPPALRPVGQPEGAKRRPGRLGELRLFDVGLARKAIADGDQFFTQNYKVDPGYQLHYYLYGLERYQSFKELAAGRFEKEPKWYNDGCTLLMNTQEPANGLWKESGDTHIISTCFAVLFLSRSSRKTITQVNPNLGQGVLLGGMGLPPNTADLTERDGKVVESPLAGSIDELLAMIEKPNAELDQLVDSREALTLDGDVTKRAGQVVRLRALVSAGNYDARMVAVRTLGRTRELDNVPVLIYALTDPDLRIVLQADRGLRFVSRKFSGVGLPAAPTGQDVQAAIKGWKAWYKSVRPEAEFLD